MTPPPVQQNSPMNASAAERNMYAKYDDVSSHIFMFNANKLHKSNLHLLDVKRKELDELAFAFFRAMQCFRRDFQLTTEKLAEVNTLQTRAENEITSHQNALEVKATELSTSSTPTAAMEETSTAEIDDRSNSDAAAKKSCAIAKAKVKLKKLNSAMDNLEEEVKEVPENEWEDQSNLVISRAFKKIEKWESNFEKLRSNFFDVEETLAEFTVSCEELDISVAETRLNLLEESLKSVKEAIKQEDTLRELYSLDISKPDPVKLPTFSGNEGEDYLAFKEKLLKGLVQNRVIRSDKLSKLRDCL